MLENKDKGKKLKSVLIGTSSVVFVLCVWQILAVTVFKTTRALPSFFDVFGSLFMQIQAKAFWQGIGNTFLKSLVSFMLSFVIGLALAVVAALSYNMHSFFRPIISILRSMPTLGVSFILFMFYPSYVAAVVIGMLVSLPLVYSNALSAINNVDERLLQMARVYRFSTFSKVKNIYIASSKPYLHSIVRSGFALNLKVIIAAEILAIPRMSVGSFLSNAYIKGDFTLLFMWVMVAVLLSFLLEFLCDLIFWVLMPYKRGQKL